MPIRNSDDPEYAQRFAAFDANPLMRWYHRLIKYNYVFPVCGLLGADASLLDVGCGSGDFLLRLKRLGFDKISGMELNDILYDRVRPLCAFYRGSILDREFCRKIAEETSGFDAVFLQSLLHHLPFDGIPQALENVRLLCADGGYVFIDEPNRLSFAGKIFSKVYLRLVEPRNFQENLREWPEMQAVGNFWPSIVRILEQNGFSRQKHSAWSHAFVYAGKQER